MHRYFSFEEINSIWNVTGGCCSINSAKLRNFLCHRAHWIHRQSIPVRVQVGQSSMEKFASFQFLDTVYQNWRNSRSNSTGKCGGSPLRFVWREVFNEGQSWLRNSSKLQGKWICTTFLKVNDFSCRHCRDLRNFNSMFAIISGLEKPAIRRLHSSWERVSGYFIWWISPKMSNLQKIHENAGRHSTVDRPFPKHVQIQTTPGWGFSRTTGKPFCFLLNLMKFYPIFKFLGCSDLPSHQKRPDFRSRRQSHLHGQTRQFRETSAHRQVRESSHQTELCALWNRKHGREGN